MSILHFTDVIFQTKKYKIWAIEDFLCESYDCRGCDHELIKNVKKGKGERWFRNLFDKNKKLGSGGFGTVYQDRHSIFMPQFFNKKIFDIIEYLK